MNGLRFNLFEFISRSIKYIALHNLGQNYFEVFQQNENQSDLVEITEEDGQEVTEVIESIIEEANLEKGYLMFQAIEENKQPLKLKLAKKMTTAKKDNSKL